MKYEIGDVVRLKRPHSEGDLVRILDIKEAVVDTGPARLMYVVHIPYWDKFFIDDDDIIGLGEF